MKNNDRYRRARRKCHQCLGRVKTMLTHPPLLHPSLGRSKSHSTPSKLPSSSAHRLSCTRSSSYCASEAERRRGDSCSCVSESETCSLTANVALTDNPLPGALDDISLRSAAGGADHSIVRDEWVTKQMLSLQDNYMDKEKISMFVGTWNVNAKKPPKSLATWLNKSAATTKPAIYAIGFQEIVDLNAQALIIENKAAGPWAETIQRTVSPSVSSHYWAAQDDDDLSANSTRSSRGRSHSGSGDAGGNPTSQPGGTAGGSGDDPTNSRHLRPDAATSSKRRGGRRRSHSDLANGEGGAEGGGGGHRRSGSGGTSDSEVKPPPEYFKLYEGTLVGIALIVFVAEKYRHAVADLRSDSVGVGIMGVGGNKGGVACSFTFFNSNICIINSHLAAHKHNVDGRNSDFGNIRSKLKFPERPKRKLWKSKPTSAFLNGGAGGGGSAAGGSGADPHATSSSSGGGGGSGTDSLPTSSSSHHYGDGSSTSSAKATSSGSHAPAFDSGDKSTSSGDNHSSSQAGGGGGRGDPNTVPPSLAAMSATALPQANEKVSSGKQKYYDLFDHDFIIWMGDLNYRLDMDDLEEVYAEIDAKNWKYLYERDQLNRERTHGRTFNDFKEGQIKFAPTYKYAVNTHEYERRDDKKQRCPSWCDRVLFYDPSSALALLDYGRTELLISDHKPVHAIFDCKVKVINGVKQRQVYEQITRQLDKWENDQIPKVQFDNDDIVFDEVRYDEEARRVLTVENTGHVVAQFVFKSKIDQNEICQPWLKVEPNNGLIFPGNKVRIKFTITANGETLRLVDSNVAKLEDILVFHLERGRDFFIPVVANYRRSCFGTSIEYLIKAQKPIREMATSNGKPVEKVLPLPKELWRMVDYIYSFGMDATGLFLTYGSPREIREIRECLDTGAPFPAGISIHSMAECLVRFLTSLKDPIFPESLCAKYDDQTDTLDLWCKKAVTHLPLSRYNAFVYMISFLREVLRHQQSQSHKELIGKYRVLFTSALMHVTTAMHTNSKVMNRNPWTILEYFLTSETI